MIVNAGTVKKTGAASLLDGPRVAAASGTARHLIVFLHGLGADGADLIGLADELRGFFPDAAFFAPNAPAPCDMAPMGYQWFSLLDRSEHSMTEGALDAAPILNATLDAELARLGLSDENLALVGFSQGTMMALTVGLRRSVSMAGIVGFSGAMVAPPHGDECQARPPVCLIHGDADMVVPFAAMGMAEALLMRLEVPVSTHPRPALGHGIDHAGLHVAAEFLADHLR